MDEICNCQQCKGIRQAEHYIDYVKKNLPYDPRSGILQLNHVKRGSVAEMMINKALVLCRDGFIRIR